MCMDYSFSEAMKNTNLTGIHTVLSIYDIMCQYCVNMYKRFEDMKGIRLPPETTILHAIGLWHVHGHKEECLYRWATTYIPGVGIVDGEALESNWSVLNRTSQSARGATTAHCAEIIDDHMGDANWKKTINIGMVNLTLSSETTDTNFSWINCEKISMGCDGIR